MKSIKYVHSLDSAFKREQNKNKAYKQQLKIECTLIGGLIPMFEINYQNRVIKGFFSRSIWKDKKAIIKMAENVVEARHRVKPFQIM